MSSSRETAKPTSSDRPRPRQGSALLATVTGAAVGVIVAVATSLVVVAMDTTEQVQPAPTTSASGTPTPSRAPAEAPPKKLAAPALSPATIAMIRSLPTGLYCRDLRAGSFSYAAAYQYWRLQDRPARMDANRNGMPCETVYSAADLNAFWY